MHRITLRRFLVGSLVSLLAGAPALVSAQVAKQKEKEKVVAEEIIELSPFCIAAPGGNLGATPGGAKDINFFRMGAGHGQIPHPNTLTAEGLLSEHDLPLTSEEKCDSLFCVRTAAAAARFDLLPDVRYVAQLGFSSGLRAETWQRAPLNLVAVVDKSGSMSGEPLALVRASLTNALQHLRDGDQISIVLYGDRAHVQLETTVVRADTRMTITERINAIESAGSTDMESGLKLGYEVARDSKKNFKGTTRVMLFTDEQPNVGDTSAEGFMGMAEAASRDGVGLTTIGAGIQFGAELATRISSVRGGNLFFFDDCRTMAQTFTDDFDFMVTELAHGLSIRIRPADGLRIAGVFGVPSDLFRWDGRALVLDVATIFLSKRKGAIFFALSPEAREHNLPARAVAAGESLATISTHYTSAQDGTPFGMGSVCRLLEPQDVQRGLSRGIRLVDQYLTIKKAAQFHFFQNDQEGAFRLISGLLARFGADPDADLAKERDLARDLHNTLALLSGHRGEIRFDSATHTVTPLAGVWRRTNGDNSAGLQEYVVVWPNDVVESLAVDPREHAIERREPITLDGALPTERSGTLSLAAEGRQQFGSIRFQLTNDNLRLEIAKWRNEPATLILERSNYPEIAIVNTERRNDDGDEIVELSGAAMMAPPPIAAAPVVRARRQPGRR